MKNKFPLIVSLAPLLFIASSCAVTNDPADIQDTPPASESTLGTSPSSSATSTEPSQNANTQQVSAEEIIPTLAQPDSEEDQPPAEVDDPSIKQSSLRTLAQLSYANEFAAINDSGELCLVAWANSGDGDATTTLSGPGIECDEPFEVKQEGLALRIDATKDNVGVVLAILPPDLTEDAVRTELLKIPGNHEDLRPPVEFSATDFGLVSVAMSPDTADNLGQITFPRPGGSDFTLELD